jgi:hypothetical protein
MIFTSASRLVDTRRAAEWDDWYIGHLKAMVSVPGITSAQRLLATEDGPPPSLALYTVVSPAVFTSPIYLRTRGMGPWQALIDPRHHHRNLFDGLDAAPEVPPGGILLVADRAVPEPAGQGLIWLHAVGLDRSTRCRGIAVFLDTASAHRCAASVGGEVALYRPVTPRLIGRLE